MNPKTTHNQNESRFLYVDGNGTLFQACTIACMTHLKINYLIYLTPTRPVVGLTPTDLQRKSFFPPRPSSSRAQKQE
jgi:hypothetical protein